MSDKDMCEILEKDNCEILYSAGFTDEEVQRLSKLRQELAQREQVAVMADYRRLQFVRWLVQTGRLTDQVA